MNKTKGCLIANFATVPENDGLLVLRSSNIKNGSIVLEDNVYVDCCIDDAKLTRLKDILICVRNGSKTLIGKSAIITNPAAIGQAHGAFMSVFRSESNEYVFQLFQTSMFFRQVSADLGATINSINTNNLLKYKFPFPPLPEQKKIAQILSTWDNAISATERLLENSQQRKKALMRQLLTGNKRLLDKNGVRFSGEWKKYQLEDLFSFKKGKGLSKADLSVSGTNKCILYGELYTRYSEVVNTVYSRTNLSDGTPSVCGDILIPSSTTTSGIDLANATAILEDNVLLGGDINILRAKKKLSAPFFAHLLTHVKKHEIASRAQGITIIHLYSTDLKDIGVFIPTELIEQQKIAEVLSVADQEISALKQKLDAFKQEKKALMQQLLTGKRRVTLN
ncbi:restriction endonuclease subunit S [Thiopseudomonas alkaliphila]|uniref:Restriction endonuclease subunit S n=1 Tax=Thiopseudomonas alkaliphila TaxID=1697053 RepID=A0AAW7DTE8_9GAMM|nr:restriction endonuclease subunit S [Thiopseudomonas alkaliphila]MDM1697387.1 restriction endonuclease subunit S [Thiopseudomonas alkaliphila]MDM1708969.1 restriction endonuclease subunit S [Thiopseudomonas alkaliphila]